jgi:hypothetical protein
MRTPRGWYTVDTSSISWCRSGELGRHLGIRPIWAHRPPPVPSSGPGSAWVAGLRGRGLEGASIWPKPSWARWRSHGGAEDTATLPRQYHDALREAMRPL